MHILNVDILIIPLLVFIGINGWFLFSITCPISIIEQIICYWLLDWKEAKDVGKKYLEKYRIADLFTFCGQSTFILFGFFPARIVGLALCRFLDYKNGFVWLTLGNVLRVAFLVVGSKAFLLFFQKYILVFFK